MNNAVSPPTLRLRCAPTLGRGRSARGAWHAGWRCEGCRGSEMWAARTGQGGRARGSPQVKARQVKSSQGKARQGKARGRPTWGAISPRPIVVAVITQW